MDKSWQQLIIDPQEWFSAKWEGGKGKRDVHGEVRAKQIRIARTCLEVGSTYKAAEIIGCHRSYVQKVMRKVKQGLLPEVEAA